MDTLLLFVHPVHTTIFLVCYFVQNLKSFHFFCRLAGLNSLDLYHEEFLHFISQYKFIIAIENAVCDDYITEKLWRPLIVGAVPIYFGSPTVEVMYFLNVHVYCYNCYKFLDVAAKSEFSNFIKKF